MEVYHEYSELNTNYKCAVAISPGNPLVCDGDQLELTCTITDPGRSLLEWTLTPAIIFMGLHRAIKPSTPSDQTTTRWFVHFFKNLCS